MGTFVAAAERKGEEAEKFPKQLPHDYPMKTVRYRRIAPGAVHSRPASPGHAMPGPRGERSHMELAARRGYERAAFEAMTA